MILGLVTEIKMESKINVMTDKVTDAVGSKVKKIVVTKGPGSDGPFEQPEYYICVTMPDDTEMSFSVYITSRVPYRYYVANPGGNNPLLNDLNTALHHLEL